MALHILGWNQSKAPEWVAEAWVGMLSANFGHSETALEPTYLIKPRPPPEIFVIVKKSMGIHWVALLN